MIARAMVATLLALLLVGLGVTIRFTGSPDLVEVALFFDIQGDVPGVQLKLDDRSLALPLLLPLDDSDPGLVAGQYPGEVVPITLREVPVDSFLRPDQIIPALLPGSELVTLWREGVGRIHIGNSEIFWVGSISVIRDEAGKESAFLVLGIGGDDPDARLPAWVAGTWGTAIPLELPEGSPPLVARFSAQVIHFEGPVERPDRFTERIQVMLQFEE